MNDKRKEHKRSRLRKGIILPILGLTVVLILIIISLFRSTQRTPVGIASEYFTIPYASALGSYGESTNTTFKLNTLSFNFTAIKQDVHNLEILDPTMSLTENNPYSWNVTKKGETETVEMPISNSLGYLLRWNDTLGGFPMSIQFTCDEAEGRVSLVIPRTALHFMATTS